MRAPLSSTPWHTLSSQMALLALILAASGAVAGGTAPAGACKVSLVKQTSGHKSSYPPGNCATPGTCTYGCVAPRINLAVRKCGSQSVEYELIDHEPIAIASCC